MAYKNRCCFLKIALKFASTHNGCRKFWKRLVVNVLQNLLTLPVLILIESV